MEIIDVRVRKNSIVASYVMVDMLCCRDVCLTFHVNWTVRSATCQPSVGSLSCQSSKNCSSLTTSVLMTDRGSQSGDHHHTAMVSLITDVTDRGHHTVMASLITGVTGRGHHTVMVSLITGVTGRGHHTVMAGGGVLRHALQNTIPHLHTPGDRTLHLVRDLVIARTGRISHRDKVEAVCGNLKMNEECVRRR